MMQYYADDCYACDVCSKEEEQYKEELNAPQELREDSEILIFEADKGGAVVVIDRTIQQYTTIYLTIQQYTFNTLLLL